MLIFIRIFTCLKPAVLSEANFSLFGFIEVFLEDIRSFYLQLSVNRILASARLETCPSPSRIRIRIRAEPDPCCCCHRHGICSYHTVVRSFHRLFSTSPNRMYSTPCRFRSFHTVPGFESSLVRVNLRMS